MDKLKFAAAQINTRVNDIAGNVFKIEEFWAQAEEEGVDLMVTPEQSISGYPLEDMAANPDVREVSRKGLDYLVQQSKNYKTAILVGIPEADEDGKIYNAAYIIDQGKLSPAIRKQHLPNNDVFDEKRIYSEGPRTEPIEFRGAQLGVAICEDIWHPDVVADLVAKGAQAIIAPNSSPYYVGKHHDRIEKVMKQRIVNEGNNVPLLYVNQVGGQDEVVFDGYSTAMNADGNVMNISEGFAEGLDCVVMDFAENAPAAFRENYIHPIYEPLEEIYNALVLSLRDYVQKSGLSGRVRLGMSGGIDSAVVAAIAVDALGAENVELIMLPSAYSSDHSISDSEKTAQMLGCHIERQPINDVMDVFWKAMNFNDHSNDHSINVAEENAQSRIRGLFLMTASNGNNDIVLSTGNKSEVAVGYCTLYGDTNGAYNPLKDLYKMKVYAIADWRNNNKPTIGLGPDGLVIEQNIIDKKPSAELRPGQVDEESLPPYPVLDDILERYLEQEQGVTTIIEETGFDADMIEDVIQKVDRAEFKRRQTPQGTKITPRSFGKGRRVPIASPGTIKMMRDAQALEI